MATRRVDKLALAGRIFGSKHLAALVVELEDKLAAEENKARHLEIDRNRLAKAATGPVRTTFAEDINHVCDLAEAMTGCMWPEDMHEERNLIARTRVMAISGLTRLHSLEQQGVVVPRQRKLRSDVGKPKSEEAKQRMRDGHKRRLHSEIVEGFNPPKTEE